VHVADPLGGSWFVEDLTDELERQAEEVFAHLLAEGSGSILEGVIASVDDGWFVSEIADAAYAFQSKIARDEWRLVGVNAYVEDEGVTPPTLTIDPAVEPDQLARLAAIKQARDDDAVRRSLSRIAADASDPAVNLMPALIEAAGHMVTVGEAMHALETVFGTYVERQVA
jgi:methylmalonyl-CoA mutase N-terminal domain/subunit